MMDTLDLSKLHNVKTGFAVGRQLELCTLHITKCKEVKFTVNGIEIAADLGDVDLSTYEAIEINGHRFERVKEKLETVDEAIDEIKMLETLLETDKYSDSVYNSFRKEVCANCLCQECIQSKMDIVECPKFENYFVI